LSNVIATADTRHYPTIDSTNLEAHRLFANGERGPLFLLADGQTAGKGRLDRTWASAKGNCYSTLILPLNRHPDEGRGEALVAPQGESPIPAFAGMTSLGLEKTPQIGFIVALAVADVVRKYAKASPKLKWPNDVLINGAKVAGILCEVLSTDPLTIAIGCGINVAHAPSGLQYPATCLLAEGATTDRDQVFQSYRDALSYRLEQWNNGQNFPAIRAAWIQNAIGIGETVTMAMGTQHLTGTFEGITEQGAVMLKPADGPHQILHAGDLHIPSLATLRNGIS
jgi:BirA family transcriptional regulator, biotin operon repressor / biotin---[acetyl-CoA-carboxylase] ligase